MRLSNHRSTQLKVINQWRNCFFITRYLFTIKANRKPTKKIFIEKEYEYESIVNDQLYERVSKLMAVNVHTYVKIIKQKHSKKK